MPLPESPTGVDRARYVREMFGAISPRYDFLNHFLSAGLDKRWRRRAAQACIDALARREGVRSLNGAGLQTPSRWTVLDLCCGTGDLALAVLAEGAGHVVACDFSRPMLAGAAAKFARKGVADRAAPVEADALALPLPDGSVDAVTCGFGLRNLGNPVRGLAEMVRVVRPGGAVVLLEFYPPQERGLLAAAFRLYFRRILPRLGAWISGGDRGAYQYLVDSIETFRTRAGLAAAMEHAGLDGVRIEPLIGCIASVYVGTKRGKQVGAPH